MLYGVTNGTGQFVIIGYMSLAVPSSQPLKKPCPCAASKPIISCRLRSQA